MPPKSNQTVITQSVTGTKELLRFQTNGVIRICQIDARRMAVLIQNIGAGNVYLGPDNTVTANTGIRLDANGLSLWDGYSHDEWWVNANGVLCDIRVLIIRAAH